MPEDDKAKSKSVSFKPRLWALVNHIVDAHFDGDRSAYFQRLVNADIVRNSAGVYYSKVVGDPLSLPKPAEDRLTRLESVLMNFIEEFREAQSARRHR